MIVAVFLRNIKYQVIEHHCFDACSNNGILISNFFMEFSLTFIKFTGNVFRLFCTSHAYEYASGISNYHNSSFRRFTIQFLSQMVRCHIFSFSIIFYCIFIFGSQTSAHRTCVIEIKKD